MEKPEPTSMTDDNIMQTYEALASLSGEMLEAARNAEWNRLISLEQASRKLVDTLPEADHPAPAESSHRVRRQKILMRILSDDAEIRSLTQPWMDEVSQFLTSLKLERKMVQSYRQNLAS
jgi:flagellar protein FliT